MSEYDDKSLKESLKYGYEKPNNPGVGIIIVAGLGYWVGGLLLMAALVVIMAITSK